MVFYSSVAFGRLNATGLGGLVDTTAGRYLGVVFDFE